MHVQTCQIAIHIYAAEAHSSLGLKVILISAAKIGEKMFSSTVHIYQFFAKRAKIYVTYFLCSIR